MFISVVIPTYNRWPILHKCLLALENQVLSSDIEDYEIVLVDDGSTDGTTFVEPATGDEYRYHAGYGWQNTGSTQGDG